MNYLYGIRSLRTGIVVEESSDRGVAEQWMRDTYDGPGWELVRKPVVDWEPVKRYPPGTVVVSGDVYVTDVEDACRQIGRAREFAEALAAGV
ncbi:hypothetical protein KDJ57_gp34 [Gordonia phage Catfish]|uniref:Uncharacterized protein n=1 Tax=Gordonia phage Catfish TaxID=2301538 RepID=A0A385D1W4_9CAUD|nr:hypothetical protein KDJ57_gp34 [Gordonia phage Catfish]AXQ51911.1 hypothetical protein SEA_CATFISH_75 [Gordonia phage Catfish]